MTGPVVALSGGVGGAKLALGLSRVLGDGELTVIVNTGDDFVHLGLAISPDIDTLLYTLAGLAETERGWGRRDETWTFMAALEQLGGETWFRLGDADLALHVERTRRLAAGATLSEVTEELRLRLGIGARICPMCDDPVRTRLRTDNGWLNFQDYFVRRRCEPRVREIQYTGAGTAIGAAGALSVLQQAGLRAVVICPSNPLLSIGPILAIPAIRLALQQCRAPIIAISPIIGGQAVKGPTVKMMLELGMEASAAEVARGYSDLIDVLVVDAADESTRTPPGIALVCANTLMRTLEDRENLAGAVLAAADQLVHSPHEHRFSRRLKEGAQEEVPLADRASPTD